MKKYLFILATLTILSSCSEYQKVLKAEEIAPKFKMGEALYNEGKFAKAQRLFAQVVPKYSGKPQAQKLMYLYAKTYFELREFRTANYQLERFVSSYPKSEKVQEAAFLAVKSFYMLSPVYSKDQSETKDAIEKLQVFINTYSSSEYAVEANKLIKELDFKLELKAYSIAKQYNEIAPGYTKDFQAAIKAFDNFVFEFPGSTLKEDALFYRLDSAYQLAINSVNYKKEARLNKAKDYYTAFKNSYTDSKYNESLDKIASELDEELKNYSNKS